jgi:hypothetical protein
VIQDAACAGEDAREHWVQLVTEVHHLSRPVATAMVDAAVSEIRSTPISAQAADLSGAAGPAWQDLDAELELAAGPAVTGSQPEDVTEPSWRYADAVEDELAVPWDPPPLLAPVTAPETAGLPPSVKPRRRCECGCGLQVLSDRPAARFASSACRVRAYRDRQRVAAL